MTGAPVDPSAGSASPADPNGPSPDFAGSDASLLRVVRAGDEAAARVIHQRYARRVIALARAGMSKGLHVRLDPDDIAQSVFRRFFAAAKAGRYDLPTGQELWDLFLVITLNRVRSAEEHHRAGKRDVRLTVGWDQTDPPDPAETHLVVVVEEAIDALPAAHREVVRLRTAGCEVAEIAAATGRSKRTVERLLQETRSRLRTALDLEPTDDGDNRRG